MKTKSSKRRVELPKKVVKLLEEANIVARFIGPLSVNRFKEKFQKEDPLLHIVSLLLAAIDDVNKGGSTTVSFLFRHASLEEYQDQAKEFLEKSD